MAGTRTPLKCPLTAAELLDMYYLDIRSHLLEAAAAIDRIESADGGAETMRDARMRNLLSALGVLGQGGSADRARRFLELFSA